MTEEKHNIEKFLNDLSAVTPAFHTKHKRSLVQTVNENIFWLTQDESTKLQDCIRKIFEARKQAGIDLEFDGRW